MTRNNLLPPVSATSDQRCKNVFYVFYSGHVFYVFNVFLIFQTFFLFLKNVGKVQSGKQINKKHFQKQQRNSVGS